MMMADICGQSGRFPVRNGPSLVAPPATRSEGFAVAACTVPATTSATGVLPSALGVAPRAEMVSAAIESALLPGAYSTVLPAQSAMSRRGAPDATGNCCGPGSIARPSMSVSRSWRIIISPATPVATSRCWACVWMRSGASRASTPVMPIAVSDRMVTHATSTSPAATAAVSDSSADPLAARLPVLLQVDADRSFGELAEPVDERLLSRSDRSERRDRQGIDPDGLLLLASRAGGEEKGGDRGRGDGGKAG